MSKDIQQQLELLKKEINEVKYDVYIDSYPISLMELYTLYKEGDINLKTEYQRVFKWTNGQKTRLIESLFLGLPIPPLFFYQDENALWEVVDGVQRLSTVFEFFGILKNEEGKNNPYLKLEEGPKIKNFDGLTFEDFTEEMKREFKKLRLDLVIISNKSKKEVKLEVFRRLNGFGTELNRQELRNALIILCNKDYFDFISKLSENEDFKNCIGLNYGDTKSKDKRIKERVHYQFATRYLLLREETAILSYPQKMEMNDAFDEAIIQVIESKSIDIPEEYHLFSRVFSLLNSVLDHKSFKSNKSGNFQGQVLESSFEAIIPGLADNIEFYESNHDILVNKIKSIYLEDSVVQNILRPNPGALPRIQKLINASKKVFKE